MAIRNVKALVSALFLQYLSYVVFYIIDELKGMAPKYAKDLPDLNPEGSK